ncbi:PREDICTED: hemK methyltransferase family member 1-like [Vollenhovia emeryi]|uniref:hemK methyltransferase family member 1-like n=1 Tax=Vollenhovia emeryi TaxID=411798 RepID=UPI0005F57C3E|nr:PREDICTED: hemK methyltransferase family member 1-like [Vollenhovia emeryi]XP_011863717.1 PREDICTED: hemK methyltransferase family member 1-like [Vollenhovia emeryi]XP_011863718.1 PREDICTED: hemK methyltransferase family member 1-like [Vollenhovia emeryi]XP_011863719.1 PREDICTED: hemK methyltransferase family member 1-like [Vollenhovia emeryi]
MWCRNVLRTRTVCNKPAVLAYFQCLTNDNLNGVTLRHPARRLLVSGTRECTIGDVIDQWSRRFESEGIPEPVESIEHIVAHVIGTKKIIDILSVRNDPLNAGQIEKLEALCECRLSRMPVQYIIGEWDFRDITVKLVPPIFIPRPETEILVDFVLKRLSSSQTDNCEVLEIGCGSGAISLALAHACKRIKCTAIDASPHACDLTMINRSKLNLTEQIAVLHATLKSDGSIEVSSSLNGVGDVDLNSKLFDFVISNPPYVPTKKIPELQPEIRIYEDIRALDGGDDGLKVIKPLLKYAAKALKPGGHLFVEVDPTHPEYIQFFTNKYPDFKLHYAHTYKDFCNNDRFVEVVKVS